MAPRTRKTPREHALAWWKERVDAHRYVVSSSESPSPAVARVLRTERLVIEVANRRIWILTEPTRADERGIFLQNYWAVVDELLRGWTPAAVLGIPAVQLHLGETAPPTILPIVQGANRSRYAIEIFDEFRLHLRPGTVAPEHIVRLPAQNGEVSVLSPADLLMTLDVQELELGLEPVSAWLRHLVIRTPELDAALAARPRTLVIARVGDLAKALGNRALAEQIDNAVQAITPHPATASATGIGTRIMVPEVLTSLPRGTGHPWLDRQIMTLERFRWVLEEQLDARVGSPPQLTVGRLVGNARQAKQYDAYHNTTMEGYRISREVSDAAVKGTPPDGPMTSQEQLRAIMAVQGYSRAFDLVIDLVRQDSSQPIDEGLILDLYGALFRPSVDAGTVTAADLRGWRTINVGLAGGWRHSPPSAAKVPSLLRGLSDFAGRTELRPLTRAVLTHLEFVTIHPFLDGNGRLGRLLMNYALLAAGYPWVTIRSDEKHPYFSALERAQVDADVQPLGDFLALHIAQAVSAATDGGPGRGRARR